MLLRQEQPQDWKENEILTREAFWNQYRPGCNEHLVLHCLRKSKAFLPQLSYVAVQEKKLVGNIVYSKLYQDGKICNDLISFGPVSVLPQFQRQGIGSNLISTTLKKAKESQYKAVLITGNSDFYHRFGFVTASKFDIHLKGIPLEEEAAFFMALELEKGALSSLSGIYEFDAAFDPSEHELEIFEKAFPPKMKRAPLPSDL